MDDEVVVVLDHDANGYGYALVGGRFCIKVEGAPGEPCKVPRQVALDLIKGNPEPWQGDGHNRFRIVE